MRQASPDDVDVEALIGKDSIFTSSDRNVVLEFVLVAPRAAKRAVLYGGKTIGHGASIVGHKFMGVLPIILKTLFTLSMVAVAVFTIWMTFEWWRWFLTMHPTIAMVMIILMVAQFLLAMGLFASASISHRGRNADHDGASPTRFSREPRFA